MKNAVQLITYADRLGGGTLKDLYHLLSQGPLAGVFGAVHILPFYFPINGADAGFDPIDHTRIDPMLGDWPDIAALSRDLDVMADVIVNHISVDSLQFRDFSRYGEASDYNGLFLTREAVFPEGVTTAEQALIHRQRPEPPFLPVTLDNGERRTLWVTFTQKQIDIDVQHPLGQAYLRAILEKLSANGVKVVRLDAVGYSIKKAGTSCFMIPETFSFIERIAAQAREMGLEVLVEVHSYYRQQIEIAARVDWVYDFALPPLMLHALFYRTGRHLRQWIEQRPTNAITVLDTHDGIGIIDIGSDPDDRLGRPGLVPDDELEQLVEIIHDNSRGQSRESTGCAASNVDMYQINCTFFDAVGRNERAYLIARAIQFFLPGIPQVYYVGLLAGQNDMDLLRRSGVGRDINRHRYDIADLEVALAAPIVNQLIEMIRLRNSHRAFGGQFEAEFRDDDRSVSLTWRNGDQQVRLNVDFTELRHKIDFSH